MTDSRNFKHSRRHFLTGASALGAMSLLGYPRIAAAEPPPEVTTIRLVHSPAICLTPEYLAEELLRLEGFTDVSYVVTDTTTGVHLLTGDQADIVPETPPTILPAWDSGKTIIALAGIHGGCYELFGTDRIRSYKDLKGARVAVDTVGRSPDYFWMSSIVSYVGIDPGKDIEWVEGKSFDAAMQLFVEGKADAFLGFPPQPQILREMKLGHVIVNTAVDRPWNQYFCCMIAALPEFVKNYPVATKRAVRAVLRASDICAEDPERAARFIVAKGYESRYDIALDVIKSLPYQLWRTHSVEDTLRFYGLRLHEVGIIKTAPNKLIAQGTDWRFLNELKRELKA